MTQPAYYPQQPPQMPQYPTPVHQVFPTQYPQPVQYQQPTPAAPPPPPAAAGTLDAFYSQPGGGAKAWSFQNMPNGTVYCGIVERPIKDSDIQQQTDLNTGAPKFFKDGRPQYVMIVPLIVQPSNAFPEGKSSWWVRGQARDELARAMAEAGAPEGAPEPGSVIWVTKVGERPSNRPGFNPSYVYSVKYQRPEGAQEAQAMAAAMPPPAAPVQPPAVSQQPVQQAMTPPAVSQQPVQQTIPVPPQPPVPANAQPPTQMTAEQQALMQQLLNTQPPVQ